MSLSRAGCRRARRGGAGILLLLPWLAWGQIQIASTRIIYPATAREVSVELANQGQAPALVQLWLDAGDSRIQPGAQTTPFLITPPITRIEAQRGQSIRIAYIGPDLPQDRESVFWLNMLEVPPHAKASQAEQNRIQFAFRSRIKLFYRPEGLRGSAAQAASQLNWRLVRQGNGYALRASNPGQYHINISDLELVSSEAKRHGNDGGGMVAPGESVNFSIDGLAGPTQAKEVRFHWLNDYGAREAGRSALH